MKNFKLTLEQAKRIDKVLLELANYDVSNGLIPVFDSSDEVQKFSISVMRKFNYFKNLIRTGEVTLIDLEDDIVSRNAALFQGDNERKELSDENLNNLIESYEKREKNDEDAALIGKQALTLLDTLLKGSLDKSKLNKDSKNFPDLSSYLGQHDDYLYNKGKEDPKEGKDGEEDENNEEGLLF